MKKILLVFVFLIAVTFLGFLSKNNKLDLRNFFPNQTSHTSTVTIRNHTFTVELATSEAEQEKGLSNRQSLDQNKGMLFIFGKPVIQSFWMKDMEFPLDIIYINQNNIVQIFPNLTNPTVNNSFIQTVTPIHPADKVLEINSGLSKKYGFQVGDTVKINL